VPTRCGAVAPDVVCRRAPRDANMRYPMGALGRGCRGFSPRRTARYQRRAIGSAGERLVHTEEVTGSIPVSPTDVNPGQRLIRRTSSSLQDGVFVVLGGIWEINFAGSTWKGRMLPPSGRRSGRRAAGRRSAGRWRLPAAVTSCDLVTGRFDAQDGLSAGGNLSGREQAGARSRPSAPQATCSGLIRDISCQHQLLGTPQGRTGRFSWGGIAARQ
jgi:hypothetical protein